MTDAPADACEECGGRLVERADAGGPYRVCTECGLRQDGLGELQKRFGRGF